MQELVINLDHRTDRLRRFREWNNRAERLPAVHWQHPTEPRPRWWSNPRSWACMLSHAQVWCTITERALIFEDDAVPLVDDWREQTEGLLRYTCDVLYLGGQLLRGDVNPPVVAGRDALVPWNVNRAHAYVITPECARWLGGTLLARARHDEWPWRCHFDHAIGEMTQLGALDVRVPRRWLITQRAGKSDVAHCHYSRDFSWDHPEKILENSTVQVGRSVV